LFVSLAILAMVWSTQPRYRATATLHLAGKTLPPDTPADARSFAQEHLQARHGRVTGSFRPRREVGLSIIEVETTTSGASERPSASIGFEIFVDDSNPRAAERATSEVAAAYLEDHRRATTTPPVPAETLEAARVASKKAAAELERLAHETEKFEQDNAAGLSGMEKLNAQTIEQSEREETRVSQELRMLEGRRNELDRGLQDMQRGAAQFSAGASRALSSELLAAVQARWAVLRGLYGREYPQAVELGAAIREAEAAANDRANALVAELEEARSEFNRLQRLHPIDHPDVVLLAHRVSALEVDVAETRVTGLTNREQAYIEDLARERGAIDGQISELRDRLAALQTQRADRESLVQQAPVLKQQYAILQEQLTNARMRHETMNVEYAALQAVMDGARAERPGELSLVAEVQTRRLIMSGPAVIGGVVCLLGVLTVMWLIGRIESAHRTIDGAELVARLQGQPPLAEIPTLQVH
jgi:DNA repair exonuclease SbcCD ATPase subunit